MSEKKIPTKTFIIEIDLKSGEKETRSADARLSEAVSLTKAIKLDVVGTEIIPLRKVQPAAYMGTGTVERIKNLLHELDAELVLMNCALSPIQWWHRWIPD